MGNCNKNLFYDKTDLDCLRRRSEPHYERIPGDIIRPSSLTEVLGQIYEYTDQLHGPSASSSNNNFLTDAKGDVILNAKKRNSTRESSYTSSNSETEGKENVYLQPTETQITMSEQIKDFTGLQRSVGTFKGEGEDPEIYIDKLEIRQDLS